MCVCVRVRVGHEMKTKAKESIKPVHDGLQDVKVAEELDGCGKGRLE